MLTPHSLPTLVFCPADPQATGFHLLSSVKRPNHHPPQEATAGPQSAGGLNMAQPHQPQEANRRASPNQPQEANSRASLHHLQEALAWPDPISRRRPQHGPTPPAAGGKLQGLTSSATGQTAGPPPHQPQEAMAGPPIRSAGNHGSAACVGRVSP